MNIKDRFWSKVRKTKSCWIWTRCCFTTGYGCACIPNTMGAHRAAWIFSRGPIPNGLCVLHKCDNRKCCNPDHLFLGTYQDNINDMVQKGRNRSAFGNMLPQSKLSDDIVLSIRKEYSSGKSNQNCLATKYGVSQATISEAINGRSWRRVQTIPVDSGIRRKWKSGNRAHQSKLSEESVIAIRIEYNQGRTTMEAIAKRLGVNKATARCAIRGITWKCVESHVK